MGWSPDFHSPPLHRAAGVWLVIPDLAVGLPVLRALSLCMRCRHSPGATAGSRPPLISPSRRVDHSLGKRPIMRPIMSVTPESQPASSPKSFKPEPRSRPKRRLYRHPSPNPTESREAAIVFCICAEGFFCSAALDRADTCHSAWGPNADRRGNSLNCLRKEGSNISTTSTSPRPSASVCFLRKGKEECTITGVSLMSKTGDSSGRRSSPARTLLLWLAAHD
jgi:hypothetical protein